MPMGMWALFRKSFKKSQIEKAMLETQKQYIKED